MSLFQNATYLASAHHLRELPPPGAPEVAFAGRSNAGKSSAINALANRTRLAFVSKTPGRTQQINFFRLAAGGLLVDLPGYGYAKVPEAMRRHWEHTLSGFLQTRASLCGLVLVMDARHPLTERDELMLGWFRPTGRPVHVLLTKADKLTRGEAALTLAKVRRRLEALGRNYTVQLFSSPDRAGVEEAEGVISGWLAAAGVAPAAGGGGNPQGVAPRHRGAGNKEAPSQRGKLGAKGLKSD
jgi:GTP-binding protein